MPLTRRSLFQGFGAAAAFSAGFPSLRNLAIHGLPIPSRSSQAQGSVLLNKNENAYGPSNRVTGAMRDALELANRYPDEASRTLARKIAEFHGAKLEQVVLGCGSSEILRMAAEAFTGPGKNLIVAVPTFELMGHCGRRVGAEVIGVPLRKDYAHDVSGMLSRVSDATGLVYVCNPNNPTGSLTPRGDLETMIRKLPPNTYILIDEAYHHYVGGSSEYSSFIDHPVDDPRVLVTRTFSKVYGLAGIRAGYGITAPQTALRLTTGRLPEDVNMIAVHAAVTALEDADYVALSAKRNADDRQEFFNQANARMIRAIDSHANFVMLNATRPASQVIEFFKKNGVLIGRPFPPFDNYVRVSLGTPPQMAEFWRVWDIMPAHKMVM